MAVADAIFLCRFYFGGYCIDYGTPINDDPAELQAVREILIEHRPERLDLLPYHSYGLNKQEAAGHGKPWESRVPTEMEMDTYRAIFKEADL